MNPIFLTVNRSAQKGVLRCVASPAVLSNKFCVEATQAVGSNPDEVIINGKKYTNQKAENLPPNYSRMEDKYRNRMRHVMQPDPEETNPDFYASHFQRPAMKKLLFAWYGKKSGIDPGTLWPSAEQLEDIKEFEEEWEPPITKLWEAVGQEREARLAAIAEREADIDRGLAKMPKYIEEYRRRMKKVEEQENAIKAKKQQMIDEARDVFGYSIEQSDPRFEQLKLAREEEEKKVKKRMQKEARISKAIKMSNDKQYKPKKAEVNDED